MSNGDDAPACPCGAPAFPAVVFNPPGRSTIAYRFGDYASVREALLRALPGETELTNWRPAPNGDLALQLVEWWAYLADTLSFYNERIAEQAWLRTADGPASVNRLIQLLGYRPRPAIGAKGVLAALLSGTKRVTLPQGLQIQSKPGPGKQPQVFELDAATTIGAPDRVSTRPQPASLPLLPATGGFLWLQGKVSGIVQGDRLLLIASAAQGPGAITDFAWLQVTSVAPATDPFGNSVTQVSYRRATPVIAGATIPSSAQAGDYQLLRPTQATPPWGYRPLGWKTPVFSATDVDLASIARDIVAGSLVLLEVSGSSQNPPVATMVVSVKAYSEVVWYANGNGPNPPDPGSPPHTPAVPITHTHLDFDQLLQGDWDGNSSLVTVRHDWKQVGQLAPVLAPQASTLTAAGPLAVTAGTLPASGTPESVLLEDANSNGAEATATVTGASTLTLSDLTSLPAQGLAAPIGVLFNLLQVSRGKSVANEVLGSGNAAVAGQDFTLQNAPVTYLQDPASLSGDNYSSTVQVSVNGLQWTEVRSFYGQAADAQVFVTQEDEQGTTHVVFGDGVNGARLPTGVNNVVAAYRYGAGADVPDAGTLTILLQPQPGLRSIRNPVPPGGGTDADPPDRVRSLAPRSVLTFDRAISLDDYAAIAASAPGVQRVSTAYTFDPIAQRPMVTIWVGDDEGAVAAAKAAIAADSDPNRPVVVNLATSVVAFLSFTYLRDPRYQDSTVQAALHSALLDPDHGLFGANVVQIGQAFYESQINAACLAVPGVQAVHQIRFPTVAGFAPPATTAAVRLFRAGGTAIRPSLVPCAGHRYDPGPGRFFVIPDDGQHLTLIPGVAT
jgi:predicted phage baseplate assembly protein